MWVSVCLSVCLSVRDDISGTTPAIFINFSVLVAYRRGSSSGRVTKSQGEGAVLGVSSPLTMVFGIHTKTAEPIDMPFGMMTRVGRRYRVLDRRPDELSHASRSRLRHRSSIARGDCESQTG